MTDEFSDGDDGASFVRRQLDLKIVTGWYSAGLVSELVWMIENRAGNVFAIFDEIGTLESVKNARPTHTKPATAFTGQLLRGLWHKHYHQAAFIPKNIQNHWRSGQFKEFAETILKDAAIPDEKKIGYLAHEFVIGGYRGRSQSGKLTGEWIVYARQDCVNYYLTLGRHGEDEAIRRRVLACTNEFPGLELGW